MKYLYLNEILFKDCTVIKFKRYYKSLAIAHGYIKRTANFMARKHGMAWDMISTKLLENETCNNARYHAINYKVVNE